MHDPLSPHRHDNNSLVPDDDSSVRLISPYKDVAVFEVHDLQALPHCSVDYRYETDHGARGPFRLTGVRLQDLIVKAFPRTPWNALEVISADGFGNRVYAHEVLAGEVPIILCFALDERPLRRAEGLVRLVVPSEEQNALRQVKWVREVRMVATDHQKS